MEVCVLGSGSKGNSIYVSGGGTSLLVDAGLSARELTARLREAGLSPQSLQGILLTHSGGFVSVYQGLSEAKVNQGEQVESGDPIGTTADGELTFSLLLNGEEVNPLDYLFSNE